MVSWAGWADEALYDGWGQRFAIRKMLAVERSAYQDIVVFDSALHGRVMLLDGVVQITEADEFAYQEMIAHVPLIQHGAARRVLIIGAGDGGVLRRVLEHRGVQRATMVEIDEAVMRLARQLLPAIGGAAWDDPRAEIVTGDGIAHVAAAQAGQYDVIVVDSTDPAGPGEALFTDAFYADCARVLAPDGILVNQCGVPFMQGTELRDTSVRRARAFAHVTAYVAAVPSYVGGFMTLGLAAKRAVAPLTVAQARARADAAGIGPTRYWSPAMQAACFVLPPYIEALLPAR